MMRQSAGAWVSKPSVATTPGVKLLLWRGRGKCSRRFARGHPNHAWFKIAPRAILTKYTWVLMVTVLSYFVDDILDIRSHIICFYTE